MDKKVSEKKIPNESVVIDLDISPNWKGKILERLSVIFSTDSGGKIIFRPRIMNIGKYLRNITDKSITLTFDEIEDIIGGKLHPSAYKYNSYWANSDQYHAQGWLDYGFKTKSVKPGKSITFIRKLTPRWCECGSQETDDVIYASDNQCICGIGKHHCHCSKCGAITSYADFTDAKG